MTSGSISPIDDSYGSGRSKPSGDPSISYIRAKLEDKRHELLTQIENMRGNNTKDDLSRKVVFESKMSQLMKIYEILANMDNKSDPTKLENQK